MLNKLQLQNLDQPLCSKSEQNFSFMTKRQLANQQTVANMILNKLWRTAYTTFFNLRKRFTAFSSCCDIIKQFVSFIAIKSTKQE